MHDLYQLAIRSTGNREICYLHSTVLECWCSLISGNIFKHDFFYNCHNWFQLYYTVTMVTQPGPDANFGEFLECAFEVYTYVRTVSNWPDTPIPPQPGCPELVTDRELLEDRGSGWSCVDKE